MDIAYVVSNQDEWKSKILEKGYTTSTSLYELIKDIVVILGSLRNDEIDDFIFRLKIVHDTAQGKKIDIEDAQKPPMRASVLMFGKQHYFKLSPKESSYSKSKSKFYCEFCGISSTFKLDGIKKHLSIFHSH